MTRRRTIAILFVVLGTLTGCTGTSGTSPRGHAGSARQPNIVFVLTDDLSTDLVQYLPHVRALQRQGMSFSHYFVVDSLCCPSRSAILTGRYPHNNGVFTNTGSDGGYDAFQRHHDARLSFGPALKRAGYRTAFLGKYLNGYRPALPRPDGWDEWDVAGNGYREYDYALNQDGIQVAYGHDPKDYLTDVLSARAGTLIDGYADAGKPFAMEVATFAPHRPATPAPRDRGSFRALRAPRGPAFDHAPVASLPWLAHFPPLTSRQKQLIDHVYRKRVESAQAVDDLVAHLQARLKANGLADDTYFVFSSDNGFHTGQYGLLPGKQTAFDTDIRVPLVIDGPGVPAGRTVSAMTSSIDLAPTFEALGRASAAGSIDGTSLVPLLRGASPPAEWQRAVLVEHHGPDVTASDPDLQSPRSGNPPSYEAMRTARATYVEYADGTRELYDLATDPRELRNVAGTAVPAALNRLHRVLQALVHCHGAASCQTAGRAG